MSSRLTVGHALIAAMIAIAGGVAGYAIGAEAPQIDWAATGAMMQGWAALMAAAAAAWGLNKWQQEIRFKRNSELAEKIMISLEGLSRAIHDARVAPHEFELDERVPGNVVLTLDAYEMRHRVLLAGGYDSELNAQRDRVAAIFGQAHEKAIADVLSVVSTTNWFFVECIAACRAVEDGRKDVEYLHRLVDVGQNVVSAGPRSQAWSRAIHQNFDNVRGLFRQSI